MALKKLARKTKVGMKVLRNEGPLSFAISGLQFIQKQRVKSAPEAAKHLVDTKVKYQAAIEADFSAPRPKWPGTERQQLRFNWIMSPPGKGSGGHLNVFRFIKFLEDAGHDCRI